MSKISQESLYWLALNRFSPIGPRRAQMLLKRFGDLSSAWQAPSLEIQIAGIPDKVVRQFDSFKKIVDLGQIESEIAESGVNFTAFCDADYPPLLRQITDPPKVLYYQGKLPSASQVCIAIVGTRNCSNYARAVTTQLTSQLALSNLVIVSGLAHGVDSTAHLTTLKLDKPTIAVLACGLDFFVQCKSNRFQLNQIKKFGCLLSEFEPQEGYQKHHFPRRNRIISGLSKATIIVEAPERSGALITARFALEQNREVGVVPGQIDTPTAKGSNLLMQEGAQPILSGSDVLKQLSLPSSKSIVKKPSPRNRFETLILKQLSQSQIILNEFTTQEQLSISEVMAVLTHWEITGYVESPEPGIYRLKYHGC